MKEQKWFIFSSLCLSVLLVLSCSKEKVLLCHLEGEWEVKSYQEYIYDGSVLDFTLKNGEANFDKQEVGGAPANMSLKLQAIRENDTIGLDWKGFYVLKEVNKLMLSDTTTHNMLLDVVRHTKNDLQLEGIFQPNRKSVIVFKKKK
jgi:hypothetical protein